MRNPQGYAVLITPGAPLTKDGEDTGAYKTVEWDTFKCNHCQSIVRVDPKGSPSDMGGYCPKCDSLICKRCCFPGHTCTPWEKIMEEFEAKERALRSYEL